MSILLTQSLHKGNQYYIFRPLGNNAYKEIKFNIVNNRIAEHQFNQLNFEERHFVNKTLLQ